MQKFDTSKFHDFLLLKMTNQTFYDIVNCVWFEWSKWSSCSENCGTGLQKRTREIKQREFHGGTPCEGYKIATRTCKIKECFGNYYATIRVSYRVVTSQPFCLQFLRLLPMSSQ